MKNIYSGFLIVDKPVGPTSFGIIYQLRKLTGVKKIGHAGTLDPFASGILVIAIGRQATRKISQYVKLDKEYEATMILGATTNTFDNEGEVSETEDVDWDSVKDNFEKVLEKFRGEQDQIPPMFSAKKVGGRKLCDLARKGVEIERQPSQIRIDKLELLSLEGKTAKIRVKCSTGTYVRTLAHDIGQALGCGAYLDELRRTEVGLFTLADAKTLKELTPKNYQDYMLEKELVPENLR